MPQAIEEDGDASIYFRALRHLNGRRHFDWYAINSDTTSGAVLSPVFAKPPLCAHYSHAAALGPFLYVLGGQLVRGGLHSGASKDVYRINTLRPQDGWEECPPMHAPRMNPYGVAVNGKLYVMGDGYLEVLEDDDRWDSLPPPPVKDSHANGHAVLDGGKQILVHLWRSGALYLYDTAAATWRIHDSKFGDTMRIMAFVDGILYYCDIYEPGVIYAYDVTKPGSCPKKVLGLEYDLDGISPKALLHVGNGKLCAVYSGKMIRQVQVLVVYCLKFRVFQSKSGESGEVNFVSYNHSESEFFCEAAISLEDCLAVFPSEGTKAEDDVCNKDDDSTTNTIKRSSGCGGQIGGNTTSKKKKNRKKKKNKSNETKMGWLDLVDL